MVNEKLLDELLPIYYTARDDTAFNSARDGLRAGLEQQIAALAGVQQPADNQGNPIDPAKMEALTKALADLKAKRDARTWLALERLRVASEGVQAKQAATRPAKAVERPAEQQATLPGFGQAYQGG